MQFYNDPIIISNSIGDMDFEQKGKLQTALLNYRTTNNYIDSIILVNDNNVIGDQMYLEDINNIRKASNNSLVPVPGIIKVNLYSNSVGLDEYVYSFLYTLDSGADISKAVVINYSEKWVRDIINSISLSA